MNKIVVIMLPICVGLLAGYALATGRIKTLFFLFAPLLIIWLLKMSARMRFTLLLVALAIVPIQVTGVFPYGLTISEIILILLIALTFMALFHFVWVEIGEDPGTAEATMEGLP